MRKVIWVCDKCKAEFASMEEVATLCDYDLCPECYEAARAAVTEFVTAKSTVRIDWGKAQALRDAGWTLEQIAGEIGSTVSSVCKNTTASKPRKKFEHESAAEEPAILKSPSLV